MIILWLDLIYISSGTLKGFDQTINLVLEDAHERIFSHTQGVEQVPLGLYLIRGDNVSVPSLILSYHLYVYLITFFY